MNLLAQQDLAVGRRLVQHVGEAQRLAAREALAARARADEDLAAVDPDPELHVVPLRRRLAQVDRCAQRAQRVVLVRGGEPEEADRGLGRAPLDGAAVAFDDAGVGVREARHHAVQRLGVEVRGERCGVRHAGADDRDHPPLALSGRLRRPRGGRRCRPCRAPGRAAASRR